MIYDAAGQGVLLEYLAPWEPEVLHVRGEQINMPAVFAGIRKTGSKFDAYVDSYIELVGPRLVVTLIDHSPRFYSISSRHARVKTMLLQSSTRGAELFAELARTKSSAGDLKVDYMMTFGSSVGAEYARHVGGTVLPIGSPINNLMPKRQPKKPGTIAFISQFRDMPGLFHAGKYRTRQEILDQPDLVVLSFLTKFAKSRGLNFFIVPCAGQPKDHELSRKERAYYGQLLGHDCNFSEWHSRGSSYDAIDTAEVVVGIDSTLGYESAARGNKTAIFSIRSQMLGVPDRTFGWPEILPDTGPFWTNRPDPAAFEQILDHLFAINEQEWKAELEEHRFEKIVAYDPANSVLRSVLQNELGAAPVPTGTSPSVTNA